MDIDKAHEIQQLFRYHYKNDWVDQSFINSHDRLWIRTFNGGESCSSCSNDCGACASSLSSSGGGGGGGGGIRLVNDPNTLSGSFLNIQPGEEYILKGNRKNLAVTKVSFSVDKFVLKGTVTANVTEDGYQSFGLFAGGFLDGDVTSLEIEYRVKTAEEIYLEGADGSTYSPELVAEDGNYSYYISRLPSFGFYSIIVPEKEREVEEIMEVEDNVVDVNYTIEEPIDLEKPVIEKGPNYTFFNVIFIGLIIMVIFSLILLRKDIGKLRKK